MLYSLNAATILGTPLVSDQIRIAAEAGFGAIGLWAWSFTDDMTPSAWAAVRRQLSDTGLRVNELCFVPCSTTEERSSADVRATMEKALHIASELESPVLVATAASGSGESDLERDEFAALVERGRSFGVSVALEFSATAKTYNTLAAALPLAEYCDSQLVVDSFHFFVGESTMSDLEAIDPKRIGLVHVSDAEHYSLQRLREVKHDLRTYPGNGFLPIVPFLETLGTIGYRDSISVEIWNSRIQKEENARVAETAKRRLDEQLRAAGL